MLKVYAASWCPHCVATIAYLKKKGIAFEVIDIETADPETTAKVVEVNGGDDWVVPTLENAGKWRPGEVFDEKKLAADLKKLGIDVPC